MERNWYPDGLTEPLIDRLIEEVDLELAAKEHTALVRADRDFTDLREARRRARRAGRSVLRALPQRIDVAEMNGEAA